MSTSINGTQDITKRHALRIRAYETARQDLIAYMRWAHEHGDDWNGELARPFSEEWAVRHLRDLSTVEQLETDIWRDQYDISLLSIRPKLPEAEIDRRRMEYETTLRAMNMERYGYDPEQAPRATIPVTIDGPVDRDAYMAALFVTMFEKDEKTNG